MVVRGVRLPSTYSSKQNTMIIAKKVNNAFDQISYINVSGLKRTGNGSYKGHITFTIDGLEFWSDGEHGAHDFESQGFVIVQEPEIQVMRFFLVSVDVFYINLEGHDDHVSINTDGLSGEMVAEIVEEETGLSLSYDQRRSIIERYPIEVE